MEPLRPCHTCSIHASKWHVGRVYHSELCQCICPTAYLWISSLAHSCARLFCSRCSATARFLQLSEPVDRAHEQQHLNDTHHGPSWRAPLQTGAAQRLGLWSRAEDAAGLNSSTVIGHKDQSYTVSRSWGTIYVGRKSVAPCGMSWAKVQNNWIESASSLYGSVW